MPCMGPCCGGRKEWLEQQELEMAAKRAHFEIWYREHRMSQVEKERDTSIVREAEEIAAAAMNMPVEA